LFGGKKKSGGEERKGVSGGIGNSPSIKVGGEKKNGKVLDDRELKSTPQRSPKVKYGQRKTHLKPGSSATCPYCEGGESLKKKSEFEKDVRRPWVLKKKRG